MLFAFDALVVGGKDLRNLPLLRRKEALHNALSASQRIRPVQHVGEVGKRLYDAACGLGLEGIMAKRADAPYRAGRSGDWIKIRTPHGRHVQTSCRSGGTSRRRNSAADSTAGLYQ